MNICIPIEPPLGAHRWGIANGRPMMVRIGDGLPRSFELVLMIEHSTLPVSLKRIGNFSRVWGCCTDLIQIPQFLQICPQAGGVP